MRHGRPEFDHWNESLDRGDMAEGWRRCHAHRVWNAMQAVVLAGLLKEAIKRDEDGGPWVVYSRGCDKANWEP